MTRKIIYSLLSTLLVVFMITACGNGESSSTESTTDENSAANAQFENTDNNNANAQFDNTGTDNAEALEGNNPMQVVDENGEVVFHYVCPNKCEGSGGPGQAPCPVCGATYEHNARFHQYQQQPGGNQSMEMDNPTIQTQQPPAQNADGVSHFICPKGCEGGGSGSRGMCSVCGTELTHNDAFHN